MIKEEMYVLPKQLIKLFCNKRRHIVIRKVVRHFTMYDPGPAIAINNDVKVLDFRSDTISLPTPAMRDVIRSAPVGDAVFNEDPSKTELERKAAELLCKEAAVFVSSGTMANLIALLVHCDKRGSEAITGSRSHILMHEQTGAAQFGGINIREVENNMDGTFSISELVRKIRKNDIHEPITRVICVENTHNILGGKVIPLEWLKELKKFAKSVEIPLHMDGARIFNAAVKLNVPVSRITEHVDTVSFCLSKGLGAPYGSVLVGPQAFIQSAQRIVKGLGGGCRQIGFMAAAGSFALDHMTLRLSEDHENIQRIANAIREISNPDITVPQPDDIHSNILLIHLNSGRITSQDFLQHLHTISENEEYPTIIKAFSLDESTIRLVVCCNISKQDVEDAVRKIRLVVKTLM